VAEKYDRAKRLSANVNKLEDIQQGLFFWVLVCISVFGDKDAPFFKNMKLPLT
jgi:hypothetical protein